MLTRFAMIFFIVSLAALMLGLSNREKAQLCATQSASTASSIASQIAQVITSPVEDERKIFPLAGSLAVGKEEFSRYEIVLTNKPPATSGERGYVLVEVKPIGTSECRTTVPVYYDGSQLDALTLMGETNETALGTALVLEPSKRTGARSSFLTVLKCKPKYTGFKTQLWIEDCRNNDPRACMNFSSVDNCCGWGWMTAGSPNPRGCPGRS